MTAMLVPSRLRITGMQLAPPSRQRLALFRANRRGFWALWIFVALFGLSLLAELIANNRPLLVSFRGTWFFPVVVDYAETDFGGDFTTGAEFRDPYLRDLIMMEGWMLWPPIRYSYNTINHNLPIPAPAPPSLDNWLGTDDHGRDVAARLIYGFRLSVMFGLALTVLSSIIGVLVGAIQGYFGGWADLLGQRFLEIWGGMPELFVLIILSSVVVPGFWSLLGILVLFSWTTLVSAVRAEFLRGRNFTYVEAARALGASDLTIMFRHVLPNAMVATLTFTPFTLSSSIVALTALDFLGLGLPADSPSLGELLRQGKENLQAPWLAITGFIAVALQVVLLVFIGEAVRDAFNPRKG
ncbi:Oligopeptide transport system permease protein OppC (TC 3.A.1.5.1) [invertebrate metagenome]|uniref:Oligopeptide transport system permease protein OppC (TC 3.A.1.5.1) n=1 Tax=invertebrate metagenome TaxID=1711999 RepID=A0A484H734_9ZZZZ